MYYLTLKPAVVVKRPARDLPRQPPISTVPPVPPWVQIGVDLCSLLKSPERFKCVALGRRLLHEVG